MDALKPLIDQLVKMIQQGQDVLSGQLPEVANQILKYEAYSLHFWMVLCLVAAIVFAIIAVFILGSGIDAPLAVFVLVVFVTPATLFTVWNFLEIKKIQMAPKIYLVEYLREELGHP